MAKNPSKRPVHLPDPLPPAPYPVPCGETLDPFTGAPALYPLTSQGVVSVPAERYAEYLAAYGLKMTSARMTGEGSVMVFVERT